MMFLLKQWTINKKIDVSWMFTGPGHRMLLEDGAGACIKQTIKDTILDNSNSIISITEEPMQDIPELSNIFISTYNKDDVKCCRKLLQDTDDLKIRESGGFGISKVHKIFIPKEDNGVLYWKKDSFDNGYAEKAKQR